MALPYLLFGHWHRTGVRAEAWPGGGGEQAPGREWARSGRRLRDGAAAKSASSPEMPWALFLETGRFCWLSSFYLWGLGQCGSPEGAGSCTPGHVAQPPQSHLSCPPWPGLCRGHTLRDCLHLQCFLQQRGVLRGIFVNFKSVCPPGSGQCLLWFLVLPPVWLRVVSVIVVTLQSLLAC